MTTPTRTKRTASNSRENSHPSKRRAVSSRRTNTNANKNTATSTATSKSNDRTPLQKLSRNEFDHIAKHLNTRNLARLGKVSKGGVGEMARTALSNRPAKEVAIDFLLPKILRMQQFVRDVVAEAAKAAERGMITMSLFERIIKRVYEPYRGSFELHITRDGLFRFIGMSTQVNDPKGGPGFMKVLLTFTIQLLSFLMNPVVLGHVQLDILTPSMVIGTTLEANGFAFRTARPRPLIEMEDEDEQYAIIYVDSALCPGCKSSPDPRKSHLAPAHLITRYTVLGEKRWCRAILTPAQAFQRVDDVRIDKDEFIKPRDMLEVVAAVFNDRIANAMMQEVSNTMIKVQRDACQSIQRR